MNYSNSETVYVCVFIAAGNAFCQAARLHMQLQNKLDSATSFVDAGNAYKKADPQGENFCWSNSHTHTISIVYKNYILIRVLSLITKIENLKKMLYEMAYFETDHASLLK